ncbi:ABC transporter ATP-binding protein [Enemella sp. A6]|uniref:ABC transporter ATP-binding protein n=1 Tax=Enemella sp. A6 TaxID=3440152 RepID=UPI003EBC3CFB
MTPVYRLEAVNRIFGATHAVRDVSFDLAAGQRLGIVGESGSGKSTLLRMMAALDHPTSGEIRFDDRRIDHLPERRLAFLRAEVQVVFQDPRSSLNPRMKVGDIITEPLRSRLLRGRTGVGDAAGRLTQVLDEVGLPADSARRYPHEFSGGQRQRIAIARALAPRPRVLLADEPVSALDVSVRAQVLNLLTDLVAEYGLTTVFVSHDLQVVRHVCDSVAVLRRGEIVESGPIEQIYDQPGHEYTRELLAAIPRLR